MLFTGLVEDWVTDRLGVYYADLIHKRRVGMPTVSLKCEFRAVSRIGDVVTLGLQVETVGNRSFTLNLDCRAGDEERVRMRQVIVTTNLDTHRAISVPDDLRAAIEVFRATH